MLHLAIHDQHGSIATLIAGPLDGPRMTVALEPGQEATEVDLAESELDVSTLDTEEAAIEALKAFRVDVTRQARLVRRSNKSAT